MDSKFLIARISDFKIGIPLSNLLETGLIDQQELIRENPEGTGFVRFRGMPVPLIPLRGKLSKSGTPGRIIVVLQHPYSIIAISVDTLEGIFELDNLLSLPEVIVKASGNLLTHFYFKNKEIVFIINVEPLLTLEEFREFESVANYGR